MKQLTGTEKQVKWANDIREEFRKRMINKHHIRLIHEITSAKFYIDNRYQLVKGEFNGSYEDAIKSSREINWECKIKVPNKIAHIKDELDIANPVGFSVLCIFYWLNYTYGEKGAPISGDEWKALVKFPHIVKDEIASINNTLSNLGHSIMITSEVEKRDNSIKTLLDYEAATRCNHYKVVLRGNDKHFCNDGNSTGTIETYRLFRVLIGKLWHEDIHKHWIEG